MPFNDDKWKHRRSSDRLLHLVRGRTGSEAQRLKNYGCQ